MQLRFQHIQNRHFWNSITILTQQKCRTKFSSTFCPDKKRFNLSHSVICVILLSNRIVCPTIITSPFGLVFITKCDLTQNQRYCFFFNRHTFDTRWHIYIYNTNPTAKGFQSASIDVMKYFFFNMWIYDKIRQNVREYHYLTLFSFLKIKCVVFCTTSDNSLLSARNIWKFSKVDLQESLKMNQRDNYLSPISFHRILISKERVRCCLCNTILYFLHKPHRNSFKFLLSSL